MIWEFLDLLLGPRATKAQFAQLLAGNQAPSLLFTSSHGMGFPNNHSLQREHQGALLCQDWPGPQQWRRPIPPDFYFSGEDVPSDASMLGMVAFCFACYGAGTPRMTSIPHALLHNPQPSRRSLSWPDYHRSC